MGLEKELDKEMKLSDADLREKIEAMEGPGNAADLLLWVNQHIYGPVLARHRDAILRLAREIEELKAERGD